MALIHCISFQHGNCSKPAKCLGDCALVLLSAKSPAQRLDTRPVDAEIVVAEPRR